VVSARRSDGQEFANQKQRVPAKAIGGTRKRLEWPQYAEGFDELHYVEASPGGGFQIEEWRDAV
jgi:hypothetical protein